MSAPSDAIGVAVVGVGRMGRHHARIYHQLAQANLLAVVDADDDRAGAIADEYGCDALASVDELLARHPGVQAVSIAVPTVAHADAARPLLERRIACLVEKPLAPTSAEAQSLIELAGEHGATLGVGHTERFNPAVRAVKRLELAPRFLEVDRVSPMTFRSLDIGVVMDMMIHDLDIVLTFADSPIRKVDAAGVAVLGEHEDVANARLVFESGCVANLTASRLALKTARKLRLFSEQGYVSLDYQRRTGVAITRSDNQAALEQVRARVAAGADLTDLDYGDLVNVTELTMDEDEPGAPPGAHDPLTAELAGFLDCVRQGREPEVSGRAGLAAIDAAERVVQAIREHKWEGLSNMRV